MLKFCILVNSHNTFSDVYNIMLKELEKLCPEEIDIFFSIDHLKENKISDRYNTIFYDPKISYTKRLFNIIDKLDYEYILILQEDWIPTDNIKIERITEIVNLMKENNIQMLRSYKNHGKGPGLLKKFKLKNNKYSIFQIPKQATYQLSWQPQIFLKKFLVDFLKRFPNIYPPLCNLENSCIQNYFRKYNLFYVSCIENEKSTDSYFFPHVHGVYRGKWALNGQKKLMEIIEKYKVDVSIRGYY